ncbi:NACHT, LRR and PYD domains-containing protein 14 isoform X3 [Papio anubis]|uniref:NACHT, LRR and PYD domains-containing protein 14 isoform X3 n=1 Tax=Papio anubis TaxID=9555 RepID=UPI0004F1EAE1|nr:NACHT, LRR and PYD domains-containing protein 14 isoform X3 [Papio anubis]
MADSSSSSFFPDFGLLLYLEELNKEELNTFKLFLKETMEPEHGLIPWNEVKKARRDDLANLMKKYYPGEKAWSVTLKIFGKMNLKDLCQRAKEEINWSAQSIGPDDAKVGVTQDQEAVLGDGTEYRIRIKEKFCITWDKKSLAGKPEDFHHGIAEKDRKLLEHLFDVDVKTGEQPQTVVLQGAAGVGKTTLVRKAMLDWAEGNLYQQRFMYVFYLNGREINQLKERSFAQLISKDWPSTEGPIEGIISQPSSLLFIIDSFDELNFAFEEPEFALCEDWTQEHPVSFLMSSLLRKVMLPEASLLVTTRLTTSKRLKQLLKNHRYVELLGMSEGAREEYIYQFFEDKRWAMKAFSSLKSNEMLFNMCQVPLVCWATCTCLKQQMEKGGDVTLTCQTTTALFTSYISSLFTPVDGCSPRLPNQVQLRRLCHVAAKGIWTMTYVFYRENLRRFGLTKSDVSSFLGNNIIQKDTEYENCYVFTHLHVQEFFAAMFYMLKGNWEAGNPSCQPFEDLKSLLQSTSYKDPQLRQMKCFLFGLLNEDRVKQLERTFNCKMSLKIKSKLLQCMEVLGNSDYSPSQLGFLELFHYLYETQDKAFISQAMRYFSKVAINICEKIHLLVSSFCLKHCRCLRTIRLSVTTVFEKKTLKTSLPTNTWDGDHITHWWQDLCSVLHTNEHLRELDLCHSNLDKSAMNILHQELRHPNCKLQKLLLKCITFPDGCQDISTSLIHNQNLMHLDLKGSDIGDNGVKSLCEALKHPECKLQTLSLESCGLTEAGCEDLSLALISNKRLTHLCLADNVLGDGGVKLMSDALQHAQCTLQSLVLRHCHFTSLSSEYLSTSLLHNKSLTHLDLGSNWLQDNGMKLLCDVFRHPSCNLQDLELMGCVLTNACCLDLASVIVYNPNLRSLDLGNNNLQDDGVKILCDALRYPNCNIQRLGLEYCGLTSLCCQDLSSALICNQRLIKMNLTQNTLGYEGIMKLYKVLKSPKCKLQVLGLCKEAFDEEAQKLLEAVGVSNPHLIIKPDCNYHNEENGSWWRCF